MTENKIRKIEILPSASDYEVENALLEALEEARKFKYHSVTITLDGPENNYTNWRITQGGCFAASLGCLEIIKHKILIAWDEFRRTC